MPLIVIAAMLLTLLIIGALIGMMALTALDPKHVPPRFHGLQRQLQAHMAPEWVHNQATDAQGQPLQDEGLAIFDSLLVREPEIPQAPTGQGDVAGLVGGYIPDRTEAPVLTDTAALPQAEALLFLRAEVGVQLGFDLEIRGTTVNMTRKEYRALAEYTGFAFDTVETPEVYLGRYGITEIHFRKTR